MRHDPPHHIPSSHRDPQILVATFQVTEYEGKPNQPKREVLKVLTWGVLPGSRAATSLLSEVH